MTCPKHPRLRADYRCPCNPPEGERGTHDLFRVNAVRTPEGVIWLETLADGVWFPAHQQSTAREHFVKGERAYRPVDPA